MNASILALSLLCLAGCSRSGAAGVPDPSAAEAVEPGQSSGQQVVDPADFMISDRVREAILRDKRVAPEAGGIRVATRDGVVTLRGFVRTEAAGKRAAVVAKAAGGVKRVDNLLVVDAEAAEKAQQHMESVVDRAISDRVRLELQRDRTTAAALGAVTVWTKDGVVTLTGSVASEAVKARFSAVARPVGSVKRVDNQLEVKKP